MPIPQSFILEGRSLVRHTLIETGTHLGATVRAALAAGFKRVASVDRFVKPEAPDGWRDDPRVELYIGSSPDKLAGMCRPDEETAIYLDAHDMGGEGIGPHDVDPVYGQCPLIAELQEIAAVPWTVKPWIVIDDAPFFIRPWADNLERRFDPKQWPVIGDIRHWLPGYTVSLAEDLLLALPNG